MKSWPYQFNRNPGYRTIEDDLLTAMLHADLMTEEGCTCPQMFHFQRAARTDKGVSAARQVVSVKLRKWCQCSLLRIYISSNIIDFLCNKIFDWKSIMKIIKWFLFDLSLYEERYGVDVTLEMASFHMYKESNMRFINFPIFSNYSV